MTQGPPDEANHRTWVRRIATLVIWWVVIWVFTSWLRMRPEPVGVLAALGVLFACYWWARDRGSGWDPAVWTSDRVGRRLRTGSDSRISYLHRLIDDAAARRQDGSVSASAASLQGILRDAAIDRLRDRAIAGGATSVPDDAQLLADTDPRLADYLLAQPPPPTTRQTVTDIINRIEAL